jgi:aminopeptidase N
MFSKKNISLFGFCIFLHSFLLAQYHDELHSIVEGEKASWLRTHASPERGVLVSANNQSNITYCRARWTVDPAIKYIKGSVLTVFKPTKALSDLEFDFSQKLTMDSIVFHGKKLNFIRNVDVLTVNFPTILPTSQSDSLTFFYQGEPTSTGFGSFEINKHNNTPVLWTLSEPYGAMEWWPCKQSLNDKIDSIDIFITHPMMYKAASNGLLVNETVANGLRTAHWKHRYPIAAYLVCMAVTDYSVFTVKAPYKNDTTTILNYVYPENLSDAKVGLADNVKEMQLYNKLFEIYPFQKEKYGHAQFGWGGGMEHQTMTFVTGYGFELLAHELAHHWFGDKVTCSSWQDLWLNEGFATYLSGLCYENILPVYWSPFKSLTIKSVTSQPDGSIFIEDTTNVNRLFNSRLTYRKGAMVLHELRWKLGDANFFQGIRNYLKDPNLAYSYAQTKDLQKHLEVQSNSNLTEFFKDWYYGQGFPSYQVKWSKTNDGIKIELGQTSSHSSVSFFEMPVPIKVSGGGKDSLLRLEHTFSGQIFDIKLPFIVEKLEFDPEYWLISANNSINGVLVGTSDDAQWLADKIQVVPNPVEDVLHLSLEDISFEKIEIRNLEGRLVQRIKTSENTLDIDIKNWQSGVYIIQFFTKNTILSKKLVKK